MSYASCPILGACVAWAQSQVSRWEEEAHKRLAEAEERHRAAERATRDGSKARRELERLKKAVESGFEDLQRQVFQSVSNPFSRPLSRLFSRLFSRVPQGYQCHLSVPS